MHCFGSWWFWSMILRIMWMLTYLHVLEEKFITVLQFWGSIFFSRPGLNCLQQIQCWLFSLSIFRTKFHLNWFPAPFGMWLFLTNILSRSHPMSFLLIVFLRILFTEVIHTQFQDWSKKLQQTWSPSINTLTEVAHHFHTQLQMFFGADGYMYWKYFHSYETAVFFVTRHVDPCHVF